MNHPKRNEINKALGLDLELGKDHDYIETGQSPFLPGDMLLLCSDGLTDMVDSEKIRALITAEGSLNEKCHKLIEAANHNGGKDNITVVLVQNDKAQLQYDTARPATNHKKNADTIINAAESPQQPSAKVQPRKVTKTSKWLVPILSVLMLIFLITSIWEFLKNRDDAPNRQIQVVLPVKKAKNKQEIKLQQVIDKSNGHTLLLSDTSFTTPIVITDAILINKDTLLIKAKGKIVLQCDSGYEGAAFMLLSKCKRIVLDSLSFVNFKVGVASFNNSLALKNVRFINCQAPVQNTFIFADNKYISGKLPGIPFKADSIPVKNK